MAIKDFFPTEIEDFFDLNKIHELDLSEISDSNKFYLEILYLVNSKEYQKVISVCDSLFQNSSNSIDKIFAIQWAVATCEVIYDIPLRNTWLKRWSLVSNWTQYPWAQFLYFFQKSLTFFFQGNLSEAEVMLKESLNISLENDYDRGIIRSYHHLGLIERDRRNYEKAKYFIEIALQRAISSHRLNIKNKLEQQLNSLNISTNFNKSLIQLMDFIHSKKHKDALKLLKQIKNLRKLESQTPEKHSEYGLWAIYLFSKKKYHSFHIVLQHITDPIVRLKILEQIEEIGELSPELLFELNNLKKTIINQNQNQNQKINDSNNNLNQSTNSIEVKRLIKLLSFYSSGISKEQIATSLWKQNYDPLYHDPKIYKLIMICRKDPSLKNRIVNTYGFYKLKAN